MKNLLHFRAENENAQRISEMCPADRDTGSHPLAGGGQEWTPRFNPWLIAEQGVSGNLPYEIIIIGFFPFS